MSGCRQRPDYEFGLLDDQARRTFEGHLGTCTTCKAAVEELRSADLAVATWSANQAVPKTTDATAHRLQTLASANATQAQRSPRGRRPAYVGAATFACAAAGAVLWMTARPEPKLTEHSAPPAVVVLAQTGAAISSVQPDGRRTITVRAGGSMAARVNEDIVAVAARSKLDIAPTRDGVSRLRLHQGSVAVRARVRTAQQRLIVEAGTYRVTVIGTRFVVAYPAPNQLTVSVSEGKVAVRDLQGRRHVVAARQRADFDDGKPPTVTHLSARETAAIDQSVLTPATATRPEQALDADVHDTPPPTPGAPVAPPETIPPPSPPRNSPTNTSRSVRKPRPPTHAAIRQLVLGGRYNKARDALRMHLARRPHEASTLWLLGECERKARRYPQAVAAYQKVITHGEPAHANRARFQAAVLLQERLRAPRRAAVLLRAYLAHSPRPLKVAAKHRLTRVLRTQEPPAEARP